MRPLAEGDISAVALTRIAKEFELSGPALYRYFANRDDLLGSLIGDAYQDCRGHRGSRGGVREIQPAPSPAVLGRSP
ncbi:TetR family transcriptional regulator [Streptomyces sp. NBC_01589]|uniref:TetR family transcriptional regulator n=1 Tax=unclassified Streptomyces TaxID=2593676 RepID=UPI00386403C5